MVLWSRAGRGRVRVDGQEWDFQPGDVCLLPWKHDIQYTADAREPFFLAGIHIIPHQNPGLPFVGLVAHRPGELPELADKRRDAPWPGLKGLKRGRFDGEPALKSLCEYIVRHWHGERPKEAKQRVLARLLVEELTKFFNRPSEPHLALPPDLQRALQFIDSHLAQPVYLTEAARVAGRSLSWLHRQFRDQLHTSPMEFVIAARIKRAKTLLATSNLSVGEIGQAVGIADPYYFSKLFTARVGQPPTSYRRQASLF